MSSLNWLDATHQKSDTSLIYSNELRAKIVQLGQWRSIRASGFIEIINACQPRIFRSSASHPEKRNSINASLRTLRLERPKEAGGEYSSASMSKVNVFITVDTEHSIGGAFRDPKLKPVGNEKRILGRIGDKAYGIPLIMDIAGDCNIPVTFFVEVLNKLTPDVNSGHEISLCRCLFLIE